MMARSVTSMGPAGALARAWLRRNLAATVLLAVLVAMVVGTSGGALAGAKRASSSLDRFIEFNRPPDVQLYTVDGSSFDVAAVTALPGVAGWASGAYGLLSAEGPGGGPFPPGDVNPFVPIASGGVPMYRPLVVDGSMPSDGDPHQIALDEEASSRLGAGVGDPIVLRLYLPEQMDTLFDGGDLPPPEGTTVDVTVTAIVRHAFDVTPGKPDDVDAVQLASSEVYPTLAFWERYGDELAAYGDGTNSVELLLKGGAGAVPALRRAVADLPGSGSVVVDEGNDAAAAVDDARQAVRFESTAMAMFGLLVLGVGCVLVGQAITRQIRSELGQLHILTGIGLTRRDITSAMSLRMAPAVLAGAGVGTVLGWGTSAALPFGTAAKAEVEPGLQLDPLPLVAVACVTSAVLLGWTAWTAWRERRVARSSSVAERSNRLVASAARSGAPGSVVVGLSLLGRARPQTSVRSSIGGVTVAVAAVAAVVVYATTADRFVDVPTEHGWGWDLLVGDSDDPTLAESGAELLSAHDGVDGFATVWSGGEGAVSTARGSVAIEGVEPGLGATYVQLLTGRPAETAGEVVLGWRTLEQLDASIGELVALEGPAGTHRFEVVGTAALHQLVADDFEIDEGIVTPRAGLERLFGADLLLSRFIVDVVDDAEVDAVRASLRDVFGPTVTSHVRPLDVASLQATEGLPVLFGGVVVLVGLGSLVHLLVVTLWRRRTELAVLRALGATRAHLSVAVATMATVTVLLAFLVGVPTGVVAGRTIWTFLADSVGATTAPVVPAVWLAAGAAAALILADAVAGATGHRIRRAPPGRALRAE